MICREICLNIPWKMGAHMVVTSYVKNLGHLREIFVTIFEIHVDIWGLLQCLLHVYMRLRTV